MVQKAEVVEIAQFNPNIKKYLFWYISILFCAFIITIPLVPIVMIVSHFFIRKYFDRLHCELTTRTLKFNKGYVFRTEKTIPLDKIQDLTFKEGPLLKIFGLSILKIETAGSSQQGVSDLTLIGIINASSFRDKVLEQRDTVTDIKSSRTDSSNTENLLSVLQDIRQSLQNIETKIE
ncbi:MAG: PH domain-containing protein [Balneolaceae bacterium]